ncbi:MAG: OmpA family protein [Pseudomonadota bacterium]
MIKEGVKTPTIRSWLGLGFAMLGLLMTSASWGSDAKPEAKYLLSGLFETRRAELSATGRQQLDDIVAQWKAERALIVTVVGHTDSIPIAPQNRHEYPDNYALSEARATTVANYLRGMFDESVARLSVQGRGPDDPIADNATAAGRKRNRRVEILIRVPSSDQPTVQEEPAPPVAEPGVEPEQSQGNLSFDDVVAQANTRLTEGDGQGALALLQDYPDFVGNPDYDYLLALALRSQGRHEEAMFALERVITIDPKFAGARMELAQIYMGLGAEADARRELSYLQGLNPPPAAQAAIAQALAQLDKNKSRGSSSKTLRYYARSAAGFDGNANSATDLNNFLGFTLSESSRETASGFSEFGGGVQYLGQVKNGRQLIAYGDLAHRFNFDASFVNATTGRGGVTMRWRSETQTKSIGLQTYRQNVSGDLNSQGLGLVGSWSFNLTSQFSLGGFGRFGLVRFGDDQEVRDVDQYVAGATLNYRFPSRLKANVSGVLLYGNDQATQEGSRYDRDFYGFRMGGGLQFTPKVRAEAYGSLLQSDFDAVFFPEQFSSPREDTLVQFGTRVSWRLNDHWTLDHLWRYQENDTDVSVFDYDRVETQITATRLW